MDLDAEVANVMAMAELYDEKARRWRRSGSTSGYTMAAEADAYAAGLRRALKILGLTRSEDQ